MRPWNGFLLVVLLAGNAGFADELPQSAAVGKPVSTISLDTVALNERLRPVVRNGSPISLVLYLIGGVEETPRVFVDMASDADSDFNRVTVTVVRDRFQDDSMRGDWHKFVLTRAADGGWAVRNALRANRCWRGTFQGYSAKICS